MLTCFTHIARTPARTLCGLGIDRIEGEHQPAEGFRVGIIVGRYCKASYVVIVAPAHDTNERCEACAEALRELLPKRRLLLRP